LLLVTMFTGLISQFPLGYPWNRPDQVM